MKKYLFIMLALTFICSYAYSQSSLGGLYNPSESNESTVFTGQHTYTNDNGQKGASLPDVAFGTDRDTGLYSSAANTLDFATDGTARMQIDSSGNVGIGAASPSQLLEVAVANADGIHVSNINGASRVTMNLDIDGDGNIDLNDSSGNNLIRLNASANGDSFFNTTGNVGIGTASPSTLFNVEGGLTTAGAVVTISTKEPTVVDNDVIGRINFDAPLETGADALLAGASIHAEAEVAFDATNNATALVFSTGTTSAAIERMRIDSSGQTQIRMVLTETTVATGDLLASECGKTIFLDDAAGAGYDLALPAIAGVDAGCKFKFIVHTPVATTDYTISTDSLNDIISGFLNEGGTPLACDTEDIIEFDNAADAVGDWIEVTSDGTLWFLYGSSFGAGFTCTKS